MDFIFKSIILISTGLIFLRITGRKSISQMTISHTIIMISIGSLIVQPIADKNIIKTIIMAGIFISFIIVLEFLQMKFNFVEKIVTGKSMVVIMDGKIIVKNLKKLRLTVDQLEMRLREQGINNIKQIRTATIEPNGQVGFELKPEHKPLTKGEFEIIIKKLLSDKEIKSYNQLDENIFDEIKNKDMTNTKNKTLK